MKWIFVFMVLAGINSAYAFDPCDKEANINHVPRADVEYNSAPITVYDPVLIPLTVDLAKKYNIETPIGTELNANFGMMEIYKDGRILYDGKDISGDIKDKCENESDEFEAIINEQSKNGDNTDTGGEFSGMVSGSDKGR